MSDQATPVPGKTIKNATDCANAVLEILKSAYGWMRTEGIIGILASNYGWNADRKAKVRSVLMQLEADGLIEKFGTGKFKWRGLSACRAGTWDRTKPMTKTGMWTVRGTRRTAAGPDLSEIEGRMAAMLTRSQTESAAKIAALEAKLEGIKGGRYEIAIKHYDNTSVKIKDAILPKVFERVLKLAECRRNIMLFGPAGCGKTFLAQLIAKSIKAKNYGELSCTAGTSESHLVGRSVPNLQTGKNVFHSTDFIKCYEEGGVFLLDELDAADANMLLCINSGLANGHLNIPAREGSTRAKKHEDFVLIGSANTVGRGATRAYQGRNQLDESTLDRFRIGIVEMDYDTRVEEAICPHAELRNRLWRIREKIQTAGLRRIMSTRFMDNAYIMVNSGGWSVQDVVNTFLEGWSDDEKRKIGER